MLKTHLIDIDRESTSCGIRILHYINSGMWRTHFDERSETISGFTMRDLSQKDISFIDCRKCRKAKGLK